MAINTTAVLKKLQKSVEKLYKKVLEDAEEVAVEIAENAELYSRAIDAAVRELSRPKQSIEIEKIIKERDEAKAKNETLRNLNKEMQKNITNLQTKINNLISGEKKGKAPPSSDHRPICSNCWITMVPDSTRKCCDWCASNLLHTAIQDLRYRCSCGRVHASYQNRNNCGKNSGPVLEKNIKHYAICNICKRGMDDMSAEPVCSRPKCREKRDSAAQYFFKCSCGYGFYAHEDRLAHQKRSNQTS